MAKIEVDPILRPKTAKIKLWSWPVLILQPYLLNVIVRDPLEIDTIQSEAPRESRLPPSGKSDAKYRIYGPQFRIFIA